jgi:hypothetical protein
MSEAERLVQDLLDLLERVVTGRSVKTDDAAELLDRVEDWLRRQRQPARRAFTVIKGGR